MAIQLPLWALGVGRGVGHALAASVTLPIWLCLVLTTGLILGSVRHGEARFERGVALGAQRERANQTKMADRLVGRQERVTLRADREAEKAQVRIEHRYRYLREKVPEYVPLHSTPGVIGAGDFVPASTVLLLDAAVRGNEPEPISVAAGQSYELAAPVRFDQLVGGYIVNLGIGHQNARQLTDLQGWVREQEALNSE